MHVTDGHWDDVGAFTAPAGVSRSSVASASMLMGAYMMPEEPVSLFVIFMILRIRRAYLSYFMLIPFRADAKSGACAFTTYQPPIDESEQP